MSCLKGIMNDTEFEIFVRIVVQACVTGVSYPSTADLCEYLLVARRSMEALETVHGGSDDATSN